MSFRTMRLLLSGHELSSRYSTASKCQAPMGLILLGEGIFKLRKSIGKPRFNSFNAFGQFLEQL